MSPISTAWVPLTYFKDDVPSVPYIATYSEDHWESDSVSTNISSKVFIYFLVTGLQLLLNLSAFHKL